MIGGFHPLESTHVHDELNARCLVLDNGETRMAIVLCDLVGVSRELCDAARSLIHAENSIPEEKVLEELRLAADEIDATQIGLFVRRMMEVDQAKDPHLLIVAKLLAECFTTHAATTWAMENKPWDFMAAFYSSIDHFCHAFMKYHPPRQAQISQREFELYGDVVNSIYRLHDLMLGRLLHLAGDDTTVILCSDHGYHSDHLRPRYSQQTVAGAAVEHRPLGILVMKGPGIKQDALIHGANIIDITPTVLHLFELPVGQDMSGKPLIDALAEPAPVETIPTWETVEGPSGMLEQRLQVDASAYDSLLKQFVALGNVPPPG